MSLSLVTVGTGTVSPHAGRTCAAYWVEADGKTRLLLDCGAGTCHRLAQFNLPWTSITHIAITHFHADHIGELPALIFAMKYGAMQPRTAPLTLIGPAGFRAKLAALAGAFGAWVTAPGFPLEVVEIAPTGTLTENTKQPSANYRLPSTVSLVTGVTLTACKTPHTDESVAFSVATSAGRLVYTGDTGPSDALGDWARGCDLLLAECSLPDAMAMDIHLTPGTAGALASRAQAKRLVLTHLYPPVETEDIGRIVAQSYSGPVTVAADGSRFEL